MKDPGAMEKFKKDYFAYTGTLAKLAMEAKAKQGIYPLRLPIGYKRSYDDGGERIVVDEQLAPLVKLAFELVAQKGLSVRRTLAVVRAKGLTGHDGHPIRRSALHRLLTNPFYTGLILYKRQRRQGIHEPLIAVELYAAVRTNLAARR